MKVLAIIDMQKDFIDGALGTKEAVSIVPKVAARLRARAEEVNFSFSMACSLLIMYFLFHKREIDHRDGHHDQQQYDGQQFLHV